MESSYLPRPGSLQNYQRHAPLVAATLLLCLFAVYLAWQVMQWMALMAAAETAGTDAVQATGAAPDLARLEQLFGPPPASQAGGALPASDLNLTLHGSFVHADPARSSAIIEQSGKPPERYSPGDEITSGVRLERVLPADSTPSGHPVRSHLARHSTAIWPPVPRPSGRAVGAQRRRGCIVSLRCPVSSISSPAFSSIRP